jgi:lysophospholipase L1-like esterase
LPILQSHAPIDLVILFLGTNDLQAMYGVSAYESSLGANALVELIQTSRIEPMAVAPQVLLVAPPRVARPCGTMEEKFRNAEEKSQAFSRWYQRVATERGCFFLDAAAVMEPSIVDGMHLDALQHIQFAQAVYRCSSRF